MPNQCADEMNACEEDSGSFFIARCNASEVFDVIEEAFDKIALRTERKVAFMFDNAICFWRNHCVYTRLPFA